jgi:hypothetical protein
MATTYLSRSLCGTSRYFLTSTVANSTSTSSATGVSQSGGASAFGTTVDSFSSSYSSTGSNSFLNPASSTNFGGASGQTAAAFSSMVSSNNSGETISTTFTSSGIAVSFAFSTNPGFTVTQSFSTTFSTVHPWTTYGISKTTGTTTKSVPYFGLGGNSWTTKTATYNRHFISTTSVGGKTTTTFRFTSSTMISWSTKTASTTGVSLVAVPETWTDRTYNSAGNIISENIPYYLNTVVIPDGNEIIWVLKHQTTLTSGYLSDLASSFSTDFTIYESDFTFSNARGISTTTSLPFSSVTITLGQTGTFAVGSYTDATTVTYSRTAHQKFFGTFNMAPAARAEAVTTTVTTSAGGTFTNVSVTNVNYYSTSTTITSMVSFASTYLETFADQQLIIDANGIRTYNTNLDEGYLYDEDAGPAIIPNGSRTSTMPATSAATTTRSTWLTSLVKSQLASNLSAGIGVTEYSFTHKSISYDNNYKIGIVKTNAQGLIPFHTAGRQANVYRGFTCNMDAELSPYAFWIGAASPVDEFDGVSAIVAYQKRSGDQFQLYPVAYSDPSATDSVQFSCTGSFITNSTAPVASGLVATVEVGLSTFDFNANFQPDHISEIASGKITVGLVSAINTGSMTGHDLFLYYFGQGHGGMQKVTDAQETRISFPGRRRFTAISSNGSSTSGTRTATTQQSSAIATSVLDLESIDRTSYITDVPLGISGGSASAHPIVPLIAFPKWNYYDGGSLSMNPYHNLI